VVRWQSRRGDEFYISVFKNSQVLKITRYLAGAPSPEGTVMTASFSLDGQEFVALNGGPEFTFARHLLFGEL